MTWTPWAAGILVLTACTVSTIPDSSGPLRTTTTEATTTTTTTTSTTAPGTNTTSLGSSTTSDGITPPGDLLVFGDWGSGTLPQGAVAGAMARYAEENPVEAIVTTGDNFYSDNAELILTPMDWVEQQDIPIWIAWGNHDIETPRRVELIEEEFDSPPRWTVHTWGDVEVVILDSTQIAKVEQLDFLAETMESSDRPAVVVFHHPVWSCTARTDPGTATESWVDYFDDDVVMVLSGHDHNYQRFDIDGVNYVVSGGGGAPLHEAAECPLGHPDRAAGETIHHFLALSQDDGQISVEVIDVNGETVDSFSVPLD